ncbi:hypothetical protein T265_07824 [Opisthorchis viverrini]|uniref:Uncharacterized protein n=1 Tax=Opisthorchis viverrini TaxID=6198 RepID=A0A074ZFX8_OPIVI|nr:hypothetical protein T265_07824 [Opisthorchis viverrini]KER24557.1 hypothetical protein T265_07824 [Opisthorchis viverrini]
MTRSILSEKFGGDSVSPLFHKQNLMMVVDQVNDVVGDGDDDADEDDRENVYDGDNGEDEEGNDDRFSYDDGGAGGMQKCAEFLE